MFLRFGLYKYKTQQIGVKKAGNLKNMEDKWMIWAMMMSFHWFTIIIVLQSPEKKQYQEKQLLVIAVLVK